MHGYCQLDTEYKTALTVLKQQLVNLHEPNEITICAKWIQRFNGAKPEEKYDRNRLVQLLIEQLADDNLNYPFIFLSNLEKTLQFPDVQLLAKSSRAKTVPSELGDILSNLNQLLIDAETLNLRTEEDLESIKSEQNVGSACSELEYLKLLSEETRNILSNHVPKMIGIPGSVVHLSDSLKSEDSEWISAALQRIEEEVSCLRKTQGNSASSASQTERDSSDFDQTFYERKFARLYADSILKDHARQIHLKSAEGLMEIDLSQKLRKHLRGISSQSARKTL